VIAEAPPAERIARHALVDRLFHWCAAATVITLMATGLLPVVGIKFAWVTVHWIVGVALAVLTILHLVRALIWQDWRSMVPTRADLRLARPAKYSLAQQLMHHAWALIVVVGIATGGAMLAKIDTPLWKRDPYLLSAQTWGVIYVLHGLVALLAVTLVMLHVYFALLPEKRLYLRSMLRGWISRTELLAQHDPGRWSGGKTHR
jgi:formate dehydrogenase subunit gamma